MEENHHHLYFFIFSSHLRKLNNYPIITLLGFTREQKLIIIIRFNSTYKKILHYGPQCLVCWIGTGWGQGVGEREKFRLWEYLGREWWQDSTRLQNLWRDNTPLRKCILVDGVYCSFTGFCILLSRMGIIGMGREGCWLNESCTFYFMENIRGNGMVVVISIKVIPFYLLEWVAKDWALWMSGAMRAET